MPGVSLSVPHYKQEYNFSRVVACVRMVLAYHWRSQSEDELRRLLGPGPHGTRPRDILRVGSLGFAVALGPSTLALLGAALAAGTPPIVFLDTGPLDYWSTDCSHVAVVAGLDDSAAWLNDPFFDSAPRQTSLAGF